MIIFNVLNIPRFRRNKLIKKKSYQKHFALFPGLRERAENYFFERLWAARLGNLGNLHGGPGKIRTANNGPHARVGLWHSYSYNAKYYGHYVYLGILY